MATNPTTELSTEGLASQGRFQRGFGISRPEGSAKQAAAAVAAGALAQTARMTGDEELAKMAAQAAEHAGETGHVEPLNEEESDRYGVSDVAAPAAPAALTDPFPSLEDEGEGEEAEEEPAGEAEEEPEEPELPAHIAAALEDEDEDEEDDDEEETDWRDYEDERPVAAAPPVSEPTSVEQIAEEFGYQLFEVETDPRVKALVETTLRERQRAVAAAEGKRKAQRKAWVTDAVTHFQFVDKQAAREAAKSATSQRDFYRRVKAENDRVRNLAERHAGGRIAEHESAREQRAQDERRQRQEMWGEPPSTTGVSGAGAPEMDPAIIRRNKGLAGVIAERRRKGQIRV